jgi:uncharacterized protein with ParB-like and HNH nuclease domain
MDKLQKEISEKKREITTDGYPMSIGELASLYTSQELDIHPEFQRFFRWTILQKSKLIESILLGIPIPSIFVSQREDGVWDVVDGLQRLSTLFQFMDILQDENGRKVEPQALVKTEYLKTLAGKYWDKAGDSEHSFTPALRIAFKREKIDIKIVKKESHEGVKFELFQRLNTLGSRLSDQEVRNCLLVLLNDNFYKWLRDLSNDEHFLNTLSISDRLLDEQYNMELALRFLIFKKIRPNEVKSTTDLGEFVTEKMRELATDPEFSKTKEEREFKLTFEILDAALGEATFKRYEAATNQFRGKFLISAFEAVAFGLGRNIGHYKNDPLGEDLRKDIRERVVTVWTEPVFRERSGSGINVTSRIPVIVPLAQKIFSKK